MKIITSIAIATVALLATAASAETAPTRVEVRYSDLNLATATGQAALASRIDLAAKTVCGVDPSQRDLAMQARTMQCHDQAVSKANVAIASAHGPVYASR